ncbi:MULTISPECIES: hypothetical protein [unclassified Streptomyces]|uniref:hypothetical protein n=1 Tax=unclassified Streptomyces TaxID=2593676 RepID=UPI003828C17E
MTDQQLTSPPPAGPGAPEVVPHAPAPRRRPFAERRVLRATLRWTAAVAVFAAVGTATAYGVTGLERTDVPGLATEPDGRWDYPPIVRPPLPSGSPAPFTESNKARTHSADLRALLLPAPAGAVENKALRGADGWLDTERYLAEYAEGYDRDTLRAKLRDYGLRHVAARGWTTPDGTRTRIYLLQFGTETFSELLLAAEAVPYTSPSRQVRGAAEVIYDEAFPQRSVVTDVKSTPYVEAKPYGVEQDRFAHIAAGDVYAVVFQSRKGSAAAVPFQQTVTLQSQLLG